MFGRRVSRHAEVWQPTTDVGSWLVGEEAEAVRDRIGVVLDGTRPPEERMAALTDPLTARAVKAAGCFVAAVAFVLEGAAPPPGLLALAGPPSPGTAFVLFAPDPGQSGQDQKPPPPFIRIVTKETTDDHHHHQSV